MRPHATTRRPTYHCVADALAWCSSACGTWQERIAEITVAQNVTARKGIRSRESASGGSVGVGTPEHPDDGHAVSGVIDSIDHAVGATARAVAVVERRAELLADAVGVLEQRADDEFVGSEGDGPGQLLSEMAASGGGDDQRERPSAHAVARRARLAAMAAARLN